MTIAVLVHSGCYKKYHRPVTDNRNSFPQFWKRKVRDRGASMVSWGPCFRLQTADFLLCPHMVAGDKGFPWNLVYKALISVLKVLPSWLKHLPRASPPYTIIFGGWDFNMWIWGGTHKHSNHSSHQSANLSSKVTQSQSWAEMAVISWHKHRMEKKECWVLISKLLLNHLSQLHTNSVAQLHGSTTHSLFLSTLP